MESDTIEEVLALIEHSPENADLYQRLGRCYSKAGNVEKARAAYLNSLALNPADGWTYMFLGNLDYQSGELEDALGNFKKAATMLPNEAIVYTCQGDIHRTQGRDELAEEAYQTAVRVAPDNLNARDKLAEWHDRRKKDARRRRIRAAFDSDYAATTVLLAEQWLREDPDDFVILCNYAEMLFKMTRYEEAIRVYEDALRTDRTITSRNVGIGIR